ncbi:type IV secretion system DNA-binding domain-containing protein (plasmid) [Halorubrum salinarum]|uniref:Type IV secretion system DNA-binding domain-containing protein n=1 Tax=Halorubrum salinarum TaxID=2739057 RepID=A0A7D3Y2M7_9EURY|nr:type IV secretion system DNA-binding domain-containing protein [Halorubrum salinarum]QKG94372.1 type IV secretion system DNA-binding domain-containing protein [Halorubrum salinarum]
MKRPSRLPDPREKISDHAVPDSIKHLRHELLTSRAYDAIPISDEQAQQLEEAAESYSGHLNRVRPFEGEDGLEYAEELIASLHSDTVSHSPIAQALNVAEDPKKFSFELLLDDETVHFHWGLPDSIQQREFRQQVSGLYPNSEIKPVDEKFPDIDAGMYLSGGKIELAKEKYLPIKATSGLDAFEKDPYQSILSELVGYSDEKAIIQFVFTPASSNWTDGLKLHERSADQISDSFNYGRIQGSYFNPRLADPSPKDKRAADAVLDQEGKQAFYVNIRYMVFGSSEKIAKHHAHGIGNIFANLYDNDEVNQGLTPIAYHDDGLFEEARRTAAREFHYDQTALTVEEMAALAHHPGEEVESTNIDWTRKGVGDRPPAEAERTSKPPDMEYQRDVTDVGGEAAAMSYLSREPAEETDTASESDSKDDSLLWSGVRVLAEYLFDEEEETTTTDTTSAPEAEVKVDSPERQEAFNEVYRQFINGELTREQIKAQYNENVADNLLRKFRERRADELGIDLDELENRRDVFDAPGARESPDEETEGDGPATQGDTDDAGEDGPKQETDATDADRETSAPDGVETTSGLPDRPTEDLPQKTDSSGLPTNDRRGLDSPAHHAHYNFDQGDTDVELRREPGLQQYFPFELKSYASGDGLAEKGDVFSGFDVRDRLIHSHEHSPDEPIWLGYDSNPLDGVREIGLEPFSWFRHATIFGSTGKGKSTTLNNMMNQIARKGYGFVFIDPKGDTVDDLIKQLPEDRMDDIVWVEPGSETFEQVAGINFLEPGDCETQKEFNREVESIIDDLRAVLRGGEYWGPKMEGITCNIARAMIRSRRKFTLVDMYYVLADNESRAKFSNVVSQEGMSFIHEYTTKIAEMDEEEVDPVLRRIQDWVEDPISRGIVAHRDGTINISNAVEDGKIILVRNTVRSDEIRKVVSTGVMRRVWSTIRKREKIEESEREPFFAIMDEFDDIASENMALDKMLSKARSGKMGVITCLQNPSQVRDFAPQTLKQMFGNSDTLISFGVTEVADAEIIAERFDDDAIDKSTFMSLPAYTALTTISVMDEDGPMRSDPLAPDTFPDYPPRRTKEEAADLIEENLKDYGVDPLEQDLDESEHALLHLGGEADIAKSFLEAVWAEQIRQNALDTLPPTYEALDPYPAFNIDVPNSDTDTGSVATDGGTLTVEVSDVLEGFKRRTSTGFEELPDGVMVDQDYVEIVNDDDDDDDNSSRREGGGTPPEKVRILDPETEITLTDKGIRAVLEQADDDWRPETEKHNEILRRAFVVLSAIGMEVSIVHQEHEEKLPDALAYPPIDTEVETKRAEKVLERFQNEFPVAADLSEGGTIAIEAETSTYKKPARTLENLARSVRNDRQTMFITPAAEGDKSAEPAARVNHILTDPEFIRGYLRMRPNEDPNKEQDLQDRDPMPLYYNKTEYLQLGTPTDGERKHAVIEKGKQTVWVQTADGKLRLYDGMSGASRKGKLRMDEHFGSTNAFQAWCRFDDHNNEWVVYPGGEEQRYPTLGDLKDDWQLVYEPFVPEREFPEGEIPSEDEWDIVQTHLPEFLSPAGGDEEDNNHEEADSQDTEKAPVDEKEVIESVHELSEDAAVDQGDNSDDETQTDSDEPFIRAGFTREAVPILERLNRDKMPSRAADVSGPASKPGSNQKHETPPEAFEPIIADDHLDKYRELTALDIVGNENDPAGIHEEGDDNIAEGDAQATDDTEATAADTDPSDIEVTEGSTDVDEDDPFGAGEDSDEEIDILGDEDDSPSTGKHINRIQFDYNAVMKDLNEYYVKNSDELDEDPDADEISIDHEAVRDRFGSKDPTGDEFWKDIWEEANLGETEPIFRDRLPGALQFSAAIRGPQAVAAVQLGIASGTLIPAGEDAIRLPGPRDAYRDYLLEDEVANIQRRDSWTTVWNALGRDQDESVGISFAVTGLQAEYEFQRPKALAAIGAGVDAGVIKEDGKKLELGERTIPAFWNELLTNYNTQPHESLTLNELVLGLRMVHDLPEARAEDCVDLGLDHGIVYNTSERYRVNTPRDDKGPEIDDDAFEREAYPPGDSDDGSADGNDGNGGGDTGGNADTDVNDTTTENDSATNSPQSQEETDEQAEEETQEETDEQTGEQTQKETDEKASKQTQEETTKQTGKQTPDGSEGDEQATDEEDPAPGSEAQLKSDNEPSSSSGETRTGTDTTQTTSGEETNSGSASEPLNESATESDTETAQSEDDSHDSDAESDAESDANESGQESPSGREEPRSEPNSVLEAKDVGIEAITLEKAFDKYGGFITVDSAPGPLGQFLNMYTEVESGEVTADTDQTIFVPKAELRDAYNAWAQINLQYEDKKVDKNAEEMGMETLPPGAFTSPLKKAVNIDLQDGRPVLEDGNRPTVWYGITLTDAGSKLAELEGKFDTKG